MVVPIIQSSIDQRLSYYRPNLKSVSWVLCHFLNVSVVNVYILYKEFYNLGNKYHWHLLEFIDNLIEPEQLAEGHILECKIRRQSTEASAASIKSWASRQSWERRFTERVWGT